MKKLFFFKSSASSSGNNNVVPPTSTNKQVCWENLSESGISIQANGKVENDFQSPKGWFSKSRKPVSESQSARSGPGLRRSRSLSSAAFLGIEPGHMIQDDQSRSTLFKDQNKSPSRSIAHDLHHQFKHSSCCRAITPEKQRQHKPIQLEVSSFKNSNVSERSGSSRNSSSCSSNISSKIVDRYIDGEQQPEESRSRNNAQRSYAGNGNYSIKLPSKIQHTVPNSPTDGGAKDKPRSHSFREAKGTCLRFSSRDSAENGFGHESPQSLAKSVIERLSHSHAFSKSVSKEFDLKNPIVVEDIYARSVNGWHDSDSDEALLKSYSLDGLYDVTNGYHGINSRRFQKQNIFQEGNCEDLRCDQPQEDIDAELIRRIKEAEERVILLSEEFKREHYIADGGCDVPALVQTTRNLAEERLSLALEVSGLLQSQIVERTSAREELRCLRTELELRSQRLEKEKNQVQSGLEKELDRRSSDWSFKLEKYQLEEQRLRERVRELAEQNVSLQREVSSFSDRETERKNLLTYTDQQLKELTEKMGEMKAENLELQKSLLEVQEKYKTAQQNVDCIRRNYEEKENECKELHKSITRLLRTCSEQEKTITGLQDGFSEDFLKNQSLERIDKQVAKVMKEQMRLTEVELALRKELESYRVEVDSLRRENVTLLNRLKGDQKEDRASSYKLDRELWDRICCLQNQGLSMLNESIYLSSKLLEFVKGKGGCLSPDIQQNMETFKNGLDGHFIVDSETKIQGLKSGIESLTRSLQMMSALLYEKSSPLTLKLKSECIDADRSAKLNDQSSEDIIKSELKAECLVTSLFREKLYSKELQVEQLQAEIATAVRGNDILRSEVQNTLDNLSCVTHKLKDLELQMLKKDESINCLQSDLQNSMKELAIMRGIFPKVSEERDLMWEKVKQYSEQNMLLNSEVNVLKKKIEALDEDILLKEGQIAILKDSLDKKHFDLLGSPDLMHEFLFK